MASDGRVEFDIVANNQSAIDSVKEVTKVIEKESPKWEEKSKGSLKNVEDDAQTTAGTIQRFFEGMFTAISLSAAAAKIGKMIKDWALAAIDTASNLEEVQNVVDVTFGEEGAKKIDEWSKKAGSQFGLTELQAKKFTSTLGAMMKSSGLAGDEIIDMSTDLAGLAADMASFYNIDFDTAFQKIRSGISGETEPLKQLGINLSVENMNDFLQSIGSEIKFGDMTQAEQTMTRYQYLLKATADAQGDFARTSGDSYANLNRQIETQSEKMKETVGKQMLPIAKELQQSWLAIMKFINGDTGPAITGSKDQLTTWMENEKSAAEAAKNELDEMADTYAYIVDLERDAFEPGFFDTYGEFVLQTLRTRQTFASGKNRERIDAAIADMETAEQKVNEANKKIQDYQEQLDAITEDTPDTAATGLELSSELADGLAKGKVYIQQQVNDINAILSQIGSTGGAFSTASVANALTYNAIHPHETGLNFVPFDGYLASLHEGEGILTAEENRIWQAFKNGQRGVDYDTLGGVMRDNVKPGGNVYLDGRVVGQVVSQMQGNSYRTLQRSGWQQ